MLCPDELVAAVTATAVAISKNLSSIDTALLSAVFDQLGDTLATLAVAKQKCENPTQGLAASQAKADGERDEDMGR